jgi:hypothetical protein
MPKSDIKTSCSCYKGLVARLVRALRAMNATLAPFGELLKRCRPHRMIDRTEILYCMSDQDSVGNGVTQNARRSIHRLELNPRSY